MLNLRKKWYKWTYLQNRNRLTDLESELMVTQGGGGGGWGRVVRERDGLGVWDGYVHSAIFKVQNQQGPMGGGEGIKAHAVKVYVNQWLIHVNVWHKPLQYCKEISLQLIKINEKKKKWLPLKNQGEVRQGR